jgi:hypothetical protein
MKVDMYILREYPVRVETKQKQIECCNERKRITQTGKEKRFWEELND